MEKLEYQSHSEPIKLEHSFGCFPALSVLILAFVSFFIGWMGLAERGLLRWTMLAISAALTLLGWALVLMILKRRHGTFSGIPAALVMGAPTGCLIYAAFHPL